MKHKQKRILIVGGVAGGASCATRLRRMCEQCEIVLFDKGPHVSFANCGLPYFVGNVITDEAKLIVASPELFNQRFNIGVHVEHEVIQINREAKSIMVKNLRDGSIKKEQYDALVLSTGSKAICPSLPGIDLPGIFVLRDIPDSHKLRNAAQNAKRAVIIGGGFIGLEMAENLVKLGISTTIIEMSNQVMPPLDAEMAVFAERGLRENGVELILGKTVESFSRQQDELFVHYSDGGTLPTDLVLLAMGVQPESILAKEAGLQLGSRGGIQVNATLQTSDPFIWAVGDVIEVTDSVTQQALSVPLAGPANRQGRIAAGAIAESFGGCKKSYLKFRGVQGTAVCQVFNLRLP